MFHVDKIYIFPYMSDLAIIEEREKERKIVNAEMSANSEKSKQKKPKHCKFLFDALIKCNKV